MEEDLGWADIESECDAGECDLGETGSGIRGVEMR